MEWILEHPDPVDPRRGRRSHPILALLAAAALLVSCGPGGTPPRETVTVYAAASLTDVLQVVAICLQDSTGIPLRFSFAGSSSLARQIEQGATADIYISANVAWMAYLVDRGLIATDTRCDLLGNRLVVIAPRSEEFVVRPETGYDFPAAFDGRLAIADPDHVPAGIYARQSLQALGWWPGVASRLAPARPAWSIRRMPRRAPA